MNDIDSTTDHRPAPRRRIAAAGLVMGLVGGGTAGLILGTPLFASAEAGDTATTVPTTVITDDTAVPDETTAPKASGTEDATEPAEGSVQQEDTTPDRTEGSREPAGSRFAERMDAGLRSLLKGLVEDGTITQDQADAVIEAITDGRKHLRRDMSGNRDGRGAARMWGEGHGGGRMFKSLGGLREIYEKLDMSPMEIARQMMDGRTIADIASDHGIDRQDLVDAATDPMRSALDKAVEEGHLTREQADEHLDRATDAITKMIDGEMPTMSGRSNHHGDEGTSARPGKPGD